MIPLSMMLLAAGVREQKKTPERFFKKAELKTRRSRE